MKENRIHRFTFRSVEYRNCYRRNKLLSINLVQHCNLIPMSYVVANIPWNSTRHRNGTKHDSNPCLRGTTIGNGLRSLAKILSLGGRERISVDVSLKISIFPAQSEDLITYIMRKKLLYARHRRNGRYTARYVNDICLRVHVEVSRTSFTDTPLEAYATCYRA